MPKRYVTFFSSNGFIMNNWQPAGTETAFTLPGTLAPLTPHKGDCLFMRGLANEASSTRPTRTTPPVPAC